MKLDVLAFGAHPDDVELGCAGTIAKMVRQGKKVGIVDLTLGELATRGDVAIREEESKKAASILGIQYRANLNLGDGFLEINEQNILKLIVEIRRHRPTTILANAPKDRHPDHGKSAELVKRANFLSGLKKIDSRFQSKSQEAYRTQKLFHYIQDYYLEPNFCIDITDFMPIKENANVNRNINIKIRGTALFFSKIIFCLNRLTFSSSSITSGFIPFSLAAIILIRGLKGLLIIFPPPVDFCIF